MLEEIDLVALYAHCDASEAETRASWRGFLSFVLAHLLETDASTSDELVSSSVLSDPEELMEPTVEPFVRQVHFVSAELANTLGASREFGIAAFLDFNPPTRTHSTHLNIKPQDDLVRQWLGRFQTLQNDEAFQGILGRWRDLMLLSLNDESAEDKLLEMDLGNPNATESDDEREEGVEAPQQQSRKKKSATPAPLKRTRHRKSA